VWCQIKLLQFDTSLVHKWWVGCITSLSSDDHHLSSGQCDSASEFHSHRIFHFIHKNAGQETVILETQAARNLPCANFHCSAVTMLIKLSSYVTWSMSETAASVQLPLNSVIFCLVEALSHMILWRQCSCSVATLLTLRNFNTLLFIIALRGKNTCSLLSHSNSLNVLNCFSGMLRIGSNWFTLHWNMQK